MGTRTKSTLLLGAILLLGVAIGIVVGGVLHNRRMERIAHLRTGPGITQLVERVVQPESEEQRERIREIMRDASPRFAELFERTQEEMKALSDSVMTQLEQVLTPEQMEALRERMDMRRGGRPRGEWGPPDRDRRRPRANGPPPGGPPPDGPPPMQPIPDSAAPVAPED